MNVDLRWHRVGPAEDFDGEEVMRFDVGDAMYAAYRTASVHAHPSRQGRGPRPRAVEIENRR